jgi:hypothetical protein
MYRLHRLGQFDVYHLTPRQYPFAWGCVFSLLIGVALLLAISVLQDVLQGVAFSVWTMWALIGGFLLLVGVPAHIGEYHASKRTLESIEAFEVSVSDRSLAVGRSFTVSYTLTFKQPTSLKRIRFACICRGDWGKDWYENEGWQSESRATIYQAIRPQDHLMGDPTHPLVQAFPLTISAERLPRRKSFVQRRKEWYLLVQITLGKGGVLRGAFDLPVR